MSLETLYNCNYTEKERQLLKIEFFLMTTKNFYAKFLGNVLKHLPEFYNVQRMKPEFEQFYYVVMYSYGLQGVLIQPYFDYLSILEICLHDNCFMFFSFLFDPHFNLVKSSFDPRLILV